jgi:hypothetical protein
MKYKLEITDNQIEGFYMSVLYSWKKKRWWKKEEWNWVSSHVQGYKWTCPEIHQGKITKEQYFERDLQSDLKREGLSEVHRIVITKE